MALRYSISPLPLSRRGRVPLLMAMLIALFVAAPAVAEDPASPPTTPPLPAETDDDPAPADEEAENNPNDEGEKTEIPYAVSLQQFQYQHRIRYDSAGNPADVHEHLHMNLRCIFGGKPVPTAYRRFEISEVITDSLESLKIKRHHQRPHWLPTQNIHVDGQRVKGVSFSGELEVPDLAARRITRLRGTVDVMIGRGKTQKVVLSPIKKVLNRKVKVKNLDEATLTVQKYGNHGYQITGPAGLVSTARKIIFRNARGEIVASRSYGTSHSGDNAVARFRVAVPEDGSIEIQVHPKQEIQTLEFELNDIALPMPYPRLQVSAIEVEARPVDQADENTGDAEVEITR
ncbi:MAG: hypothetical protein R3336_02085 [Phycisphaeraceae bacterium]|nr:hypothetical protein [Phycisphaeraceae bacterium]